ncbi:MAG: GNAT family N-acetyltransferase [Betaproteobacteria bacterium]
MILRPALPDDLPAITVIYGHHVIHGLASFETEPPSLEEMQARFSSITAAGYPYWVAVEGERVLGYAYASAFRTRPAYRYTVEDSVYVAPDAVGRGTGRALLERLIAECEARGYRQILAVIGDSDNQPSIKLHTACGFGRMAVFNGTGFKHGRWVDTVFMQRALGAGDRTLPI